MDSSKALSLLPQITHPPIPMPDKYSSIHTLNKDQKISFLKDNSLDPIKVATADPYDGIAHAYHLWTEVGAKAKANPNISFTQQRQIASNFYDHTLGPIYAHSGLGLPDKATWMKQAYEEALNYKIEDAYQNDLISAIRHGWNSGLATTARAADRLSTLAGNAVTSVFEQFDRERTAQAQRMGWHLNALTTPSQIDTSEIIPPNAIARGARWQDAHRQFWADALPAHDGALNKSASFVADQVAQAPIYAAMYLGNKALGAAAKGAGLTQLLNVSPAGKKVFGYLVAGGEGLAYGAATHKQDDPGEMWRDAVGFLVFHGLFDIGGMGLKKLIDIVPSDTKLGRVLGKQAQKLDMAQEGAAPDSPVEQYNKHKTEVANNLYVGGVATQRAIYIDALHHVQEMESVPGGRNEVRQIEAKLLQDDPARWTPTLSAARFIRSLLGDNRLSTIKPGSPEAEHLSSRLSQLIVDAGTEMNTRVQGLAKESAEEATPKNLSQPSASHTLEYYVQKVQDMMGSSGVISKEQVQKAAQKLYADDLAKAAKLAEKEVGPTPSTKAQNISKRIKPALRVKTERTVGKSGDVYVRHSIIPDFSVYLRDSKKAASADGKTLRAFFADMDDRDFMDDLSEHFYPSALRDAKVWFEGMGKYTSEKNLISAADRGFGGKENANFLAFMYNYKDLMPKEFAEELQSRLIGSTKAQKFMRGNTPTEPQLEYFAKSMYNHVDTLLASGRWPKESNIFRSSNEQMFKTTPWQRELLVERGIQEQKNLREAFSGDKKAQKLALATHAALNSQRLAEFDQASMRRGSQDKIRSLSDQIADMETQTGKRERINF